MKIIKFRNENRVTLYPIVIVILFFLFSHNSFCFEGIGVSIGGGYYFWKTDKTLTTPASQGGASAFFALQIPLVESHRTEIEVCILRYWNLHQNNLGNASDVNGNLTILSYGVRIFLFDYKSTFRPSIHIGATTIPIISWSAGLACDYKIINNLYLQLSSWFFADGLMALSGLENPPPIVNLSLKYYLK